MGSLVCIDAAHNPAAAGPRVQIPPRNQLFSSERFSCAAAGFSGNFCEKEELATKDCTGQNSRSITAEKRNPA